MALDQSALKDALQTIFEDTSDPDVTAEQKADEIASAIDDYIKQAIATVTIPTGTVLVGATAGVPNPTPITLTGDPNGDPDNAGGLS